MTLDLLLNESTYATVLKNRKRLLSLSGRFFDTGRSFLLIEWRGLCHCAEFTNALKLKTIPSESLITNDLLASFCKFSISKAELPTEV